jgi:N-acyl-D-aspartate/D-glutamate deacylase
MDLVTRHGTLFDGHSDNPREADIGIQDGIITRAGQVCRCSEALDDTMAK